MASKLLYYARCPKHQDAHPSLAVYDDGHVHCFACAYHTFPQALPLPPGWWRPQEKAPLYRGPIPWVMVDEYAKLLYGRFAHRLAWFRGRGLWPQTVEKLHLGHTGAAFTIPVWSYKGELLNIRYRRDDLLGPPSMPKYKGLAGRPVTLYGTWQDYKDRAVWLCEGELDAARLMQEFWLYSVDPGVALSTTGGCGGLSRDLAARLQAASLVVVCYDLDAAGREAAALALRACSQIVPSVRVTWPLDWGKDVTTAIQTVGFETWFKAVLAHVY